MEVQIWTIEKLIFNVHAAVGRMVASLELDPDQISHARQQEVWNGAA